MLTTRTGRVVSANLTPYAAEGQDDALMLTLRLAGVDIPFVRSFTGRDAIAEAFVVMGKPSPFDPLEGRRMTLFVKELRGHRDGKILAFEIHATESAAESGCCA